MTEQTHTEPSQPRSTEPSKTHEHASQPDPSEPSAAYLALASAFLCITGTTLIWLRHRKLVLPKPGILDLVLVGLGTARLSRLITRDKVMRPLRAPFTATEPGEIEERAKGSGMIRAAGELITCPRCTAIWAAGGLSLVYLASPSSGRFAGMVLSSSLISDYVNRRFAILNNAEAAQPSAAK